MRGPQADKYEQRIIDLESSVRDIRHRQGLAESRFDRDYPVNMARWGLRGRQPDAPTNIREDLDALMKHLGVEYRDEPASRTVVKVEEDEG